MTSWGNDEKCVNLRGDSKYSRQLRFFVVKPAKILLCYCPLFREILTLKKY